MAQARLAMSIVVHHLEHSRSVRILWLLEELGLGYEVKTYRRDKQFRAPPEFAKVHPLGRSPVVEVDGRVLAESGAVIEYFVEREGKLRPSDSDGLLEYRFFMHYAEGSAMPPLIVQLIVRKMRTAKMPFFAKPIARSLANQVEASYSGPAIDLHFGFVNDTLQRRTYFAGDEFSAADIQMLYPVDAALFRRAGDWSALREWRKRVTERDAYRRAEQRGGPTMPPG
jgi:glutathione S-transferase